MFKPKKLLPFKIRLNIKKRLLYLSLYIQYDKGLKDLNETLQNVSNPTMKGKANQDTASKVI